ncbi:MAG: 3',5'-cyclic AMP phosphodiesterase CpdA [Verrucomicrobiales bacterium]|jgi:3',5'-cyclic AMP phosphodiesterase CpdA
MKILHFGDIHVWRLRLAPDFWYLKRVLGTVNLIARRRLRFPSNYPAIVAAEVLKSDADVVIFSGDMSTMSLVPEFEEAARLFAPIREKWGDRFFCIPGNHDRYSPGSMKSGGYERYFPYGAFEEDKLVRRQLIDDGLVIVGFDCSHPCRIRSNGTISDKLERELRTALEFERGEGNRVLLTGHYPLAYPSDVHASWEHRLLKAERLAKLVNEFEPIAYFHGHKHQRWIERVGKTLCVNCGAAGMISSEKHKQAGFVTGELDRETLTKPVAHYLDRVPEEFATYDMEIPG